MSKFCLSNKGYVAASLLDYALRNDDGLTKENFVDQIRSSGGIGWYEGDDAQYIGDLVQLLFDSGIFEVKKDAKRDALANKLFESMIPFLGSQERYFLKIDGVIYRTYAFSSRKDIRAWLDSLGLSHYERFHTSSGFEKDGVLVSVVNSSGVWVPV